MRHGWLVALAALLVPAPASAQSADAGAGGAASEDGEGGGPGDELPPMMRDPRQLSGIARGEANDPPGKLTVRAVQGPMKRTEFGDIKADFPARASIHLVAYDASGKVTLRSVPLDPGGRAVFDKLASNGTQAYAVLATFPRQGAEDRLVSRLVTMPPQVGMRMMLAGEAIDSDKPPVDDLNNEELAIQIPGPGMVVVYLRGDTKDIQEVELLEAGSDKPVQRAKVEVVSVPDSPDGQVKPPEDDRALRPGLLEVKVARRGQGLASIPVEIAAADAAEGATPARTGQTDAGGRAVFEPLPAGKKYVVRAPVQGRTFESAAFDPPRKTGQRIAVEVDWRETKGLQARFTGVEAGGDKVYFARAADQPRPFLTMPFQLTSAKGAATNLIAAPPVLFAFHGGATLEDEKLFFQLQISLYNASLAPYQPPKSGLRIPLPTGFSGASVEEEVAARVKVDEDRGLVWRGLLPPGEHRFIAAFSLASHDGKSTFTMPMPYGLWSSQLVFEKTKGVRIEPPAGMRQQNGNADDGRPLLVFQGIQLDVGQSLTMRFSGLPQHPWWQKWVRRGIGVLVLGLLAWGVWGVAVRGRRSGGRQSHLEAEREELLQAVVQLEADLRRQRVTDAVYQQRRGELLRQLEGIYAQLAESAAQSGQAGTRASPSP